jgi:hypothetical protein
MLKAAQSQKQVGPKQGTLPPPQQPSQQTKAKSQVHKPKKERRKSASSIDTNELTDMDRKEDFTHYQDVKMIGGGNDDYTPSKQGGYTPKPVGGNKYNNSEARINNKK